MFVSGLYLDGLRRRLISLGRVVGRNVLKVVPMKASQLASHVSNIM
jgi:hypothetical protein